MLRTARAFILSASLLAGSCDARTPPDKVDTNLIFSSPWPAFQNAATQQDYNKQVGTADTFLWSGLEGYKPQDKDDEQEKRLLDACFRAPGNENAFPLLFLVGPLISLFTDKVKSSLDDELKKYAADFNASSTTSFYIKEGTGAVQQSRCFRVTRTRTVVSTDAKGNPTQAVRTVDFDLIGEIAVVGANDVLAASPQQTANGWGIKVRPLRVFLARPLSKGSSVAMAATLAVDAVWRDGTEGKKETVFTTPVLERKFEATELSGGTRQWMARPELVPNPPDDPNGKPDPGEFPRWGRLPLQPMIPWNAQLGAPATQITATFHATEVGEGETKKVLTAIKNLFDKSQSDLNSTLTAAAKKLVSPEAPAPSPALYCGTFTPTPQGGGSFSWSQSSTCASSPAQ